MYTIPLLSSPARNSSIIILCIIKLQKKSKEIDVLITCDDECDNVASVVDAVTFTIVTNTG
jgi:hypothetical protein